MIGQIMKITSVWRTNDAMKILEKPTTSKKMHRQNDFYSVTPHRVWLALDFSWLKTTSMYSFRHFCASLGLTTSNKPEIDENLSLQGPLVRPAVHHRRDLDGPISCSSHLFNTHLVILRDKHPKWCIWIPYSGFDSRSSLLRSCYKCSWNTRANEQWHTTTILGSRK